MGEIGDQLNVTMIIDQVSNVIRTGVSYQGIFMIRDVILIRTKDLKVSVLK